MIRPRHPLLALAFSLLLVGMQFGAQLHALEHLRDSLRHTPAHSLTAPADEPCAMCALFAGGANAVTAGSGAAFAAPDACQAFSLPPASPAASAPSYYSSRAPPVLL
jgi:hypothetical protein